MRTIDTIYIDGQFVTPHGEELFDLFNPATEEKIGQVRLADAIDAKLLSPRPSARFRPSREPARPNGSRCSAGCMTLSPGGTTCLRSNDRRVWRAAVVRRLLASRANSSSIWPRCWQTFALRQTDRRGRGHDAAVGRGRRHQPWNSNSGFICGKLATALAAGCTAVIKPERDERIQTQVVTEALHEAGLPAGVFNIVTGRGDVVGAEITSHPGYREGLLHRLDRRRTLDNAHGGRDDEAGDPGTGRQGSEYHPARRRPRKRDPTVIAVGFANSGQACVAGTRILAPRSRLPEIIDRLKTAVAALKVGDPRSQRDVGPMVSQKQWDRVQGYIKLGIEEGAELLVGGEGRPRGLDRGWFVATHRLHRRQQRHAHRPRGNLRPGAVCDPLRRRGGGDHYRQRHILRPPGLCRER